VNICIWMNNTVLREPSCFCFYILYTQMCFWNWLAVNAHLLKDDKNECDWMKFYLSCWDTALGEKIWKIWKKRSYVNGHVRNSFCRNITMVHFWLFSVLLWNLDNLEILLFTVLTNFTLFLNDSIHNKRAHLLSK